MKPHQLGCPKPLRDTSLTEVRCRRVRCLECNRTFRIYPRGVSRDQQSDALKALTALLYILGLSYGDVSKVLERLGSFLSKATVYHTIQKAGHRVQELRQDWLVSGYRIVEILDADSTGVRCAGPSVLVEVVANDATGVEIYVEALDDGTDDGLSSWLQGAARAVGANFDHSARW